MEVVLWDGRLQAKVEGVEATIFFGLQLFYPDLLALHTFHTLHFPKKSNKQ